jgi:hypothetical protein
MPDTIQRVIEEGDVTKGRRTQTRASQLLPNFGIELGFTAGVPNDAQARSLEFIVDVILPISWHATRLKDALNTRRNYIIGTGALILLIPAALAFMPVLTGKSASSTIIAQLAGGLTGVLALQKMVGQTLAAQQRYGAWWKVSSDLKKLWYGFQTRWGRAELQDFANWATHGKEFLEDMAARIDQARQLVSDEEADFFQKLTLPSVDVLDLLSKTRPDVSSMIGALLPGAASASAVATALTGQATDLVKARQDIAKNRSLLASLDAEIAQKRAELDSPPTGQTAQQTTDALNALLKRHNEVVIAKIEAEAAVAAAMAS